MRAMIIVAIVLSDISMAGSMAGAGQLVQYLGNLPPASQPPAIQTNPYQHSSPQLYDSQGQYRGNLDNNPYLPDSITNPHGRYGSPYSPYRQDNPNSPYG